MDLLVSLATVVFVNMVLSGDNAVVIAMASHALPPAQQKKAILWGSGLAVVLRVFLVVVATFLLNLPYLQFAGGLALVYIAYRLLTEEENELELKAGESLWDAVKIIVAADLIMSLDNVLAIAGVANGDWLVLGVGLAVSVTLVIFGAQLLSSLMNRFPVLVYIGAGLIAWTAGEMLVSDRIIGAQLEPYGLVIKVGLVLAVLAAGYRRQAGEKD